MSRIRLESCTLEIDGSALLKARPTARVRLEAARLVVPVAFVASAVKSQLPGFSIAVPVDQSVPQVDFAGQFDVAEMLPAWAHRFVPDDWQGMLDVDGELELRTTPSGRLQVVVLDAAIAGLHLPKALNIQRRVLEIVRTRFLESPLLRKGTGDALFEIDLKLLASKLSTDLELPRTSSVAVEGDSVVVTYGAVPSSARSSASPAKRASAPRASSRKASPPKGASARPKAPARKRRAAKKSM